MGLTQTFFPRNIFVTIPRYSIDSIEHNELIHTDLNQLISTFTFVEEASIRTITSLTSIMKLNMGNIVIRRNKSYIYQE